MAEFALTVGFLFVLGLIVFDFARFFMNMAMAEYAAHVAVRVAAVRPPVCAGVPDTINRVGGNTTRYGTLCSDAPGSCVMPSAQCAGGGDPTSAEIIALIAPLLPAGANAGNLLFSYNAPPADAIGFLGGPYVPVVSVTLTNLQHNFILPIPTLLSPWSGAAGGAFAPITLPPMTATMPGEDLNVGTNG